MKKASCEIAVKKRPLLLVLSGPSGAGKDAVLAAMSDYPFDRIVTVTTRAPRAGEKNGREYQFVTPDEFTRMREQGELLEWASVYGNWYGVPRRTVELALGSGRDVIIKVDVQGAATIKKLLPQAILIYLVTPSIEELGNRLRGRASDAPSDISLRLRVADEETRQISRFDYLVVNQPDVLGDAVSDIRSIIQAEKCRVTPDFCLHDRG